MLNYSPVVPKTHLFVYIDLFRFKKKIVKWKTIYKIIIYFKNWLKPYLEKKNLLDINQS